MDEHNHNDEPNHKQHDLVHDFGDMGGLDSNYFFYSCRPDHNKFYHKLRISMG